MTVNGDFWPISDSQLLASKWQKLTSHIYLGNYDGQRTNGKSRPIALPSAYMQKGGMKFLKPRPGQSFAFWFHWQLDKIENAYKASRASPDSALADNRRRTDEMQRLVDAGEASWAHEDEEGYPDYGYAESLADEEAQHEQVLSHVRLAFLIVLFHFWEQSLAKELPREKGAYKYHAESAFAWLENFGWTPLREQLLELELVANCAKHSEGRSANTLWEKRKDLFDRQAIEKHGLNPGYDLLEIKDMHVAQYFETVRNSIPRMGVAI